MRSSQCSAGAARFAQDRREGRPGEWSAAYSMEHQEDSPYARRVFAPNAEPACDDRTAECSWRGAVNRPGTFP